MIQKLKKQSFQNVNHNLLGMVNPCLPKIDIDIKNLITQSSSFSDATYQLCTKYEAKEINTPNRSVCLL